MPRALSRIKRLIYFAGAVVVECILQDENVISLCLYTHTKQPQQKKNSAYNCSWDGFIYMVIVWEDKNENAREQKKQTWKTVDMIGTWTSTIYKFILLK